MKNKIALFLMAVLVVFSPVSAGITGVSSIQAEAAVKNPVKVSLSTTTPKQNSTITLNVSGVPKNTAYTGTIYYKTTKTPVSGKVGVANKIKISRATKGYKVKVEIVVKHNKQTYKSYAYFTPR
ncbi:hypothetical protein HB943_05925 [Listeria weihenstephanensis]|uniref:Bacterial Ig domain-containing protein n=1 Tax=Listeria weihenstephanensis TaxID=1006155 RepID=A0A841Z6Z9_9LIST|nr:hypothetical protein [Listeria weihenstephanensis]MBC1500136.1 hypothetical protein [Listeria weihenstephanensis]